MVSVSKLGNDSLRKITPIAMNKMIWWCLKSASVRKQFKFSRAEASDTQIMIIGPDIKSNILLLALNCLWKMSRVCPSNDIVCIIH